MTPRPDGATEALAEAMAEAAGFGDLYRDQRDGIHDYRPAVLQHYRDKAPDARKTLERRGYIIRKARKSG